MKTITVTQTYELVVSIEVEVSDEYTYDDMVNSFTDFPIRVDVNEGWEETENVKVIGVCVDALDSLTGSDSFVLYGEKDNEWVRLEESDDE